MKVESRFPAGAQVELDELIGAVAAEPADGRLTVGDQRIVDFLTAFSRRLLVPSLARRHPELGSLGFFLRRNEIRRALDRMRATPDGALVFPRGVVFHVPPANVDTIFVYSWALSALAGNANLVRVSARAAGAAQAVLEALNETLAEAHPVVAQTQRMITYGREEAITARLSQACDLRVIWGGDAAVTEIRRHPLAPSARDLTFPDRASFAAINVPGWHAADAAGRRAAIEGFANDSYWFDQAACASPRTVFLVGGEATGAARAQDEFLTLLAEVVRERSWGVDAAMAVEKRVSTYGIAAEGGATEICFAGNAVTSLALTDPGSTPRRWLGAGAFPFAAVDSLASLAPVIERKDQTFSHFGFTRNELVDFATALGGRGIDRIVPFGSALTFAAIWDGYDLLREFTRLTTVSG